PSPVIDRSCAEVPRIEVPGYDNELFGMLAAFQIGDHVVADRVGKFLRSKREVHADFALSGKMRDQRCIFSGNSPGRNAGRKTESSVRQSKVGAAYRAH